MLGNHDTAIGIGLRKGSARVAVQATIRTTVALASWKNGDSSKEVLCLAKFLATIATEQATPNNIDTPIRQLTHL